MSAPALAAALVAALDDQTLRVLADRLRPYLEDQPDRGPLLTSTQAAERLRLHPKTVVRMARDGRLPAVKVGTGWRFRPDQLDIAPLRSAKDVAAFQPRCRRMKREPASVAAIRGNRERSAA